MQVAIRSSLTAGVAVVAASALLMSPVSPSAAPDIQVPAISSAKVELAAATDPFTPWLNVFSGAFTNVVGLGQAVVADPAPALRQLLANQVANGALIVTNLVKFVDNVGLYLNTYVPMFLESALAELRAGNITGAATIINQTLGVALFMAFPLFSIVGLPAQAANTLARVAEAVTGFQVLGSLAGGVLGPIMGANTAIAVQAQAFVDSLGSNDLIGAVSAIINTPAALVGAVLNGITDPTSNEFLPGLLTVPSSPFDPAGLIYTLTVAIPRSIADALAPPTAPFTTLDNVPESDPASLPDLNASFALKAPADEVVDEPKIEAEPVVNVVEEADAPVADNVVSEPAPAPEPEADAEPSKEKAADTRINTKKGNKVVPGQVKTGVANNDSSPATEAEPTATDDDTGTTGTGATGSEGADSGDSGDSDGGGSDE